MNPTTIDDDEEQDIASFLDHVCSQSTLSPKKSQNSKPTKSKYPSSSSSPSSSQPLTPRVSLTLNLKRRSISRDAQSQEILIIIYCLG
ncbi:hypothetical protein I302_105388 [Kwoniella bestiolae CBS 10118]|uniref:Uncharacterized protein n=1 Tax=Kwoniella bestiolae CBS 10118 TaxID=1296100 RepID=A0AAJ8MA87_9TREE